MYKLAFIGGGINSIAGYPHFVSTQMDKRFEIVTGVFSTDKKINQETAKLWNIKKVYSSWQELIKKEQNSIDAVVVLVPTPLHSKIILELLKRKIPIICEKPLVSSAEEIKEIEKIYDPKQNFLVVTNNYSGYPMVRELQEKINKGELGDILQIRLKMPQESFLRPPKSIKYPQKWRLKDGFIPMISLDLGSHLHHLAYFLLHEEPIKIFASYDKFSKYNIVDNVNIFLKYKSKIDGNFWLSKSALGNRNGLHIEVYGSKASAIWHQENPEILELSYNTGQKIIVDRSNDLYILQNKLYNRMTPGHPAGFIEAFANLYSDIANSLEAFLEGKEYLTKYIYGFEHAKKGIKLLHNATISQNNKSWVEI